MSNANDGGPAFHGTERGMSLRDWFAGQVLSGGCTLSVEGMAEYAYRIADAMLAERAAFVSMLDDERDAERAADLDAFIASPIMGGAS